MGNDRACSSHIIRLPSAFGNPGDIQADIFYITASANSRDILTSRYRMTFVPRPRFHWRLRTRTLELGARTLVMGILNVTPDSFSDGGLFLDTRAALTHALQMLDEGADLLDIGGESTRPNSQPISSAEEQARVLPVLRAILAARPEAILSIDTYHADTARLAIEAGAEIVNDVSGHLWDPAMSSTCATLACGNILMHTRGRPQQWRTLPALAPGEVVPLVLRDLESRARAALAAGIARNSIVLDPGFGFGKRLDENFPVLAHLDQLHTLGFPLLAGLSRKSFLRSTPNPGAPSQTASPSEVGMVADHLTTAANTAAILAGVHILRVHDIPPARAVAAIADRLLAPDLHTGSTAP
jgi:dihydropteroate synthase